MSKATVLGNPRPPMVPWSWIAVKKCWKWKPQTRIVCWENINKHQQTHPLDPFRILLGVPYFWPCKINIFTRYCMTTQAKPAFHGFKGQFAEDLVFVHIFLPENSAFCKTTYSSSTTSGNHSFNRLDEENLPMCQFMSQRLQALDCRHIIHG